MDGLAEVGELVGAFEVEFVTKDGHTAAVLTLTNEDIRPMNQEEKNIHLLDLQMNELEQIVSAAEYENDFDAAKERLRRWKTRAARLISLHIDPNEGRKLEKKRKRSSSYIDLLSNIIKEADMYRAFVQALREEIQQHPEKRN